MKILIISDIVDERIYSKYLKDNFSDIDLVLSAGDLPYYYLEYIVTILNVPLLYVHGNHDSDYVYKNGRRVEAKPLGCIDIHRKTINIKGLIIGGLEGSMKYNKKEKYQYSESQMHMEIAKMYPYLLYNKIRYGRFIDILLTHSPVFGYGDGKDLCHRGFKSFISFINLFSPKILVHGHIHLYDINKKYIYKYKDTTIINASRYKVINLSKKGIIKVGIK